MKHIVHYYIYYLTDLLREGEPIIKEVCKDLYTDREEFIFGAYLHYLWKLRDYPTAKFVRTDKGAQIVVDGVMVYEVELLCIDPEEIEIPDYTD